MLVSFAFTFFPKMAQPEPTADVEEAEARGHVPARGHLQGRDRAVQAGVHQRIREHVVRRLERGRDRET